MDASAKIYAGRVDAIHSEMYKVLSGLGRGSNNSQKADGEFEVFFEVICILHITAALLRARLKFIGTEKGPPSLFVGSCISCIISNDRNRNGTTVLERVAIN